MMMISINPTSILSWGGFIQAAFILLSLFIAIKSIKGCDIGKSLLIVTMSLAFFIGIYHGALLSALGRSAWNPALPFLFLSTSLASGFLFLLLIGRIKGYLKEHSLMIDSSLVIFLLLSFVSVVGWLYGLEAQDEESKLALSAIFDRYFSFMLIATFFGILLPLFISLKSLFAKDKNFKLLLNIVSIAMLIGIFLLKFVVVYVGQLEFMV